MFSFLVAISGCAYSQSHSQTHFIILYLAPSWGSGSQSTDLPQAFLAHRLQPFLDCSPIARSSGRRLPSTMAGAMAGKFSEICRFLEAMSASPAATDESLSRAIESQVEHFVSLIQSSRIDLDDATFIMEKMNVDEGPFAQEDKSRITSAINARLQSLVKHRQSKIDPKTWNMSQQTHYYMYNYLTTSDWQTLIDDEASLQDRYLVIANRAFGDRSAVSEGEDFRGIAGFDIGGGEGDVGSHQVLRQPSRIDVAIQGSQEQEGAGGRHAERTQGVPLQSGRLFGTVEDRVWP